MTVSGYVAGASLDFLIKSGHPVTRGRMIMQVFDLLTSIKIEHKNDFNLLLRMLMNLAFGGCAKDAVNRFYWARNFFVVLGLRQSQQSS